MTQSAEYIRDYYQDPANKERKLTIARTRRHMNFYQAIEYLGGKCVDCGYHENLRALQFDHIVMRRQDLRTRLWDMMARPFSSLKVELDKCQLRCANCHAIRSSKQREELYCER